MGRIKTTWMKNISEELISKYPEKFNVDFDQNKNALRGLALIDSKSQRNKVAGYITRLMERKKVAS